MIKIKPKALIFIIAICLLVEGCRHNEAVVVNHSATETAIWEMTWDSVFATQTQVVSVTSESTNEVLTLTPTPKLVASPSGSDEIAALQCETYLETAWGNKAEQWGHSEDIGRFFSLLPLTFREDNEIYFSDFANLRLLKYNGIDKKPMQTISLVSFFPDGYVYWSFNNMPHPPVSLISISQDKIYVPYGGNRIGVLSVEGEVINDIAIPEYYYAYDFPTRDHAWVDEEGNLAVFWGTSFKVGWEEFKWVKIQKPGIRYYVWNEYLVEQDNISLSGFDISVYKKDISGNLLQEYTIPVNPVLRQIIYFPIFGVDKNGYLYLKELSENPAEQLYARYFLPTGERQVASLPYPYAGQYTNLEPSVSPDGILYFVAYNNKDLSVSPKILTCSFPKK